jgi:hypothetical protein
MIQKDCIQSKNLDMLTYKTLGIAKPAIRPQICYPYGTFYYIKINVFSFVVPTIDIMQIFVVKGQTNTTSTNYRLL